jgi:ricin-type beta-trefoil lectin protein
MKKSFAKSTGVNAGVYFILSSMDPVGRVVDIPSQDFSHEDGTIQLIKGDGSDFQKWVVTPVASVPGTFTISSKVQDGKYLEPDRDQHIGPIGVGGHQNDPGQLIKWYPASGSAYQRWVFEDSGNGTYRLKNDGSGLYWDLKGEDPQHIQQLEQKPVPNQLWILQPTS